MRFSFFIRLSLASANLREVVASSRSIALLSLRSGYGPLLPPSSEADQAASVLGVAVSSFVLMA